MQIQVMASSPEKSSTMDDGNLRWNTQEWSPKLEMWFSKVVTHIGWSSEMYVFWTSGQIGGEVKLILKTMKKSKFNQFRLYKSP